MKDVSADDVQVLCDGNKKKLHLLIKNDRERNMKRDFY